MRNEVQTLALEKLARTQLESRADEFGPDGSGKVVKWSGVLYWGCSGCRTRRCVQCCSRRTCRRYPPRGYFRRRPLRNPVCRFRRRLRRSSRFPLPRRPPPSRYWRRPLHRLHRTPRRGLLHCPRRSCY
jgi:hypothetical protein